MLAALLASLAAQAPAAAAAEPRFVERSCPAEPALPRARCGTVAVPEDRTEPGGRTIRLNVVILPSPTPARLPPLFDIDGGPGLNATKNADFYAVNGVSKDRDVVMVDQRGTGRSNALACPDLSKVPPTEPMLPAPAVARCLAALQGKASLRHYGTTDAVEDLEAVRRALGYGQVDLFGLSYGTTVALAYMRRYPEIVRAAVLMGTAPPTAMPPQNHATAADRALKLLLADCAANAGCAGRFPDLAGDLGRARALAAAGSAPLPPELLMERIRAKMYAPAGRAALPLAIHRAAAGDFSAFLGGTGGAGPPVADGMFLAVTCGESFPLMDYPKAEAAARATPFGDYRLVRQRAACAGWPRVRLDRDHLLLPANSPASVLLISGQMDPVTPPEWADDVARALPRARHIIIPGGGHIPDGLANLETCLDALMIAFLDHGDPARLDPACVATMTAPAYVLE